MLGKRIINTGTVACTTDTNQILDPGTTDSVALYRFEDNADDTSNSTGKFGKGAGLDGTTSIELPGQILGDLHNANTHSISVSTWIYWQGQTSESYAHLISAGYNQSGKSFWVGIGYAGTTSGVINELYVSGSGVSGGANWSGVSMPINEWSHVVFTWTGTTSKLYLNGNLIATTTMPTLDWRSSGNGFRLGRYYYNSNYYTKGFYDQTRIFNKAITQTEVNTLYAETTSTVDTVQILGDTSLKALYKFDGNLNDSSGNNYAPTANSSIYYNYNGTASGVTYVTGKFGKAASFDGSNDYIELPLNTSSFFAAKNTLSVSLWFKTNGSISTNSILFSDYNNESYNIFSRLDSSGRLYVANRYQNLVNNNSTTSVSYDDSNWHHLVITNDVSSLTQTIYVDGSVVNTNNINSSSWYSSATGRVSLGANYSTSASAYANWWNGLIDQVRIFKKSLSPGEVNSLYNETATSAALSTIDNPSTVAYYKMADATDETGSYNLTASNVDFNVEGKYGFAGKFNGTNSYLYAANSVQQPTTNFSASVWVYLNANSSGGYGIVGNFQSGVNPQKGWVIARSSADTKFSFWADGTANSNGGKVVGTTVIQTGVWYHVVGTYDGTSVKIYVNGSLENSATYSATPGTTNQPLVIGRWYGNYNDYYTDGKIDQVRIFNKAISATEVTALYNEIQCANTITAPESYFNTKLWTGDGNARSITGIGFDPDFVWIKKRANDTKDHRLFDTVRGANKVIYSSRNLIEATPTQELTAFVSGGFSLGNHTSVNDAASDTYVSWNWRAGGILNQSAVFNGSSSYITTPSVIPTNNFSFSFWVNMNSFPGSATNQVVFVQNENNNRWYIAVYESGKIQAWNGSSTFTTSSSVINLNQWHNVVYTASSSSGKKIYVDGTEVLSDADTNNNSGSASGNLFIGFGKWYTNALYLDGKLDQVRIFNKAISDSEVTTLYNETSSTINTLQVLGDTSCVAAFPLGANANDLNTNNASSSAVNVTFNNPGHLHRNNNGTIGSVVSASPESGFSIVKYKGNGTAGATVGHGLGVKPEFILFKNLDTTVNWIAYDTVNNVIGYLDLNDSLTDGRRAWAVNNTDPTSTLVTLGNNQATNAASDFIMYCFANVDGHQRIGSYFGNGSANGPFVFTGFEPAWLMIKRIDAAGEWNIFDNKRDTENPRDITLWAQDNSTESTASQSGVYDVDFFTNGFQIKNSYNPFNNSSGTYLFMAIAANPDTTAPTKANSFKTVLYTGNGDTTNDTLISGVGFKPDLVWIKARTTYNHVLMDSVRGTTSLTTHETTTERTNYGRFVSYEDDGFKIRANNAADLYKINRVSNNFVAWNWKALDHDRNLHGINTDGSITTQVSANPAAGFSIASYRGVGYPNATTATVGHGLSQAPDLVIIKGTGGTGQSSGAGSWVVGTGVLASDNWLGSLYLNSTGTYYTAVNYFWNGSPTSSVVKLKNDWFVNGANNTYIMYSWHTVAGYSKVGVYSGTGISGKEVTLDFSPSFVLIKRTNATAGWIIVDDQRSTYELYPHVGNQEDTTTTSIVLGTNKFTINSTGTWYNATGGTYLYMAFS